jgi:hypothetical protein
MPGWVPSREGELPSLGWLALDWVEAYLAAPDKAEYEPLILTQEQADFVVGLYRLNPVSGDRLIHRGVLSRPRGWGKSPLLAALAAWEALGEPVFDGWDADGQPVGRPWSDLRTPLVQIGAVSETQTLNSWTPLLEMLRNGPAVDEYVGLEPLDSVVNLPRGWIRQITSSATTVKGARAVFAVLDQTEEWTKSNGGVRLAQTMRDNATKLGGCTVESPNAFTPGAGSVAEESAAYWAAIQEGRARTASLLYDHREAPPDTDIADETSLVEGLRVAYGDSSDDERGCVLHDPPCAPGWSPIKRIAADFFDLSNDPQVMRADFLNQITHAADSWLTQPEWAACTNTSIAVADGDMVTLGFDGSRFRTRGYADATALVACRVSDGHTWLVRAWEQPEHWAPPPSDPKASWQVPTVEVEAEIRTMFDRYRVVGFYADPARWESYVAAWEAAYKQHLQVGRRDHPIEWWMTGGRQQIVARAIEQFHSAVVERDMTHDGGSTLTRHVLNARRRVRGSTVQIGKEHPDSIRKIDAAVAAVLAWQARLDAVAKGIDSKPRTNRAVFI